MLGIWFVCVFRVLCLCGIPKNKHCVVVHLTRVYTYYVLAHCVLRHQSLQVAKQQEALHGSNAEAEAEARKLETEIGALKSRLTSNDELHATEVASLKSMNEKAAAAHAEAVKVLQAQLTEAQKAAAEGEVAKLQATQLQAKVDALVRWM